MPEFRKCKPESPEEGGVTEGKISRYRAIKRGHEREYGRGKVFADIIAVKGEKEREAGTYVIKKFTDKESALAELQKALDLRELGIPVPETIRYAELNGVHTLLYSDLTEGGKHEVWSQNDPTIELFYLGLTEGDLKTLEEGLTEIAQKATDAGYLICSDSPFLQRKRDGSIKVIIADLGYGVYRPEDVKPLESKADDLDVRNMREAKNFVRHVERQLERYDALPDARDMHFYKRLLPLTDGVRMITQSLETGGCSREEVVRILKGCGVEEDEELLTRPLAADQKTKDLGLERLDDINPILTDRIRSGNLSTADLKKAATLYRYAKETDERLKQQIKEAGYEYQETWW